MKPTPLRVRESPLPSDLSRPLQATSLKSQVTDVIRDAIFAGKIKPGETLREMHLARAFSVSQATIREALVELQRVGLAIRVPNRGTFVTRLSPKDVRDRLAIRALLEPQACIEASERLTEENYSRLGDLASEIAKDYTTTAYYETSQADLAFHRYIWERSGNPTLATLLEQVTVPLFAFIGLLRKMGVEDQRRGNPHEPIITALKSRDPAAITDVVRAHFKGSYSRFVESRVENLQELVNSQP